MTDLFISYSRRDLGFVQRLHEELKSRNRDIWIDLEDIPPTSQWLEEIYDGIEAANAFVFIISPDSAASEVCKLEIEYAVRHGKKLVPILHREVEPRSLLHPSLASHNWLFFRDSDDFERAFRLLNDALDTDLDHVRMHTRLLMRAREWEDRKLDGSFLLRGTDLLDAEGWLSTSIDKQPEATNLHQQYIFASRKAETGRQRSRLVAVTAAFIVSVVLGIIAFIQWREADAARLKASVAQSTAVAALISVNDTRGTAQAQEDTFRATIRALGQQAQLVVQEDAGEGPEVLPPVGAVATATAYATPTPRRSDELPDTGGGPGGSGGGGGAIIPPLADAAARYQLATSPADQLAAKNELVRALQDSGLPFQRVLSGHNGPVLAVAYSPDGQRLVSAGDDNTIIIWNTANWERIGLPLYGHGAGVTGVSYSPTGRYIASSSRDGSLLLWDAATGEIVRTFSEYGERIESARQSLGGMGAWVLTLDFSPDGTRLVSGGADSAVNVWDVESGSLLRALAPSAGTIYSVAFSADGRRVAAGGDDGTVMVWDSETGQPVATLNAHMGAVFSLDFSPDGRTLASGGADNLAILWDAERLEPLHVLAGANNVVLSVAYSPDSQTLATGTAENVVRLWEVGSGVLIGDAFKGYGDWVYSVAFNPAGDRLASGSSDGTVVILPAGMDAWLENACTAVGRNITAEEWAVVFPDAPYREICPGLP